MKMVKSDVLGVLGESGVFGGFGGCVTGVSKRGVFGGFGGFDESGGFGRKVKKNDSEWF
jgi:hypothetical protein